MVGQSRSGGEIQKNAKPQVLSNKHVMLLSAEGSAIHFVVVRVLRVHVPHDERAANSDFGFGPRSYRLWCYCTSMGDVVNRWTNDPQYAQGYFVIAMAVLFCGCAAKTVERGAWTVER